MSCRTTKKTPREQGGGCKNRLRRGKKMLEGGRWPHGCTSQIYDFRSQMYADGKIWGGRGACGKGTEDRCVSTTGGKKTRRVLLLEGRKRKKLWQQWRWRWPHGYAPPAASGTNLKTPGLFSSRVHPLLSPHFTAISSHSPSRSSNFPSPQSPSLSDALYVADSLGLRFALQTLRRRGLLLR